MEEKSQSEKSSPESSCRSASNIAPMPTDSSPSLSVDPLTPVIAEMQRMSPAAMGQLAGPMLEVLNLADTDAGGAEMLGTPVYARLWDEDGSLRRPFPSLIRWYMKRRPSFHDPLAVASFTVRVGAVITAIEDALEDT
jgi:hypothetical protein